MSLQGSLDGFPLPDVLALLASTKKRGELRVAGHQGAGRVWMADGAVVGAESGSARVPVDVLFQLLRVESGSFTFDPAATVPAGRPLAFESLLAEAQERLAEWHVIEAVVPSLATPVDLSADLPSPEVTVTDTHWRVLRAVAGGGTVADVAHALDLDEFHACRAVKDLVDAGLVAVGDGASEEHDERQASDVGRMEDEVGDAVAALEAATAGEEDDDEATDDDLATATRHEQADADDLVSIPDHLRSARRRAVKGEPGAEPTSTRPAARRSPMAIAAARRRAELGEGSEFGSDLVGAAAAALTPENASALVRELAELGTDTTEAVEVIQAASRAPSTEAKAAALEGVLADDEGEPLNRALLVKFLSSVRS